MKEMEQMDSFKAFVWPPPTTYWHSSPADLVYSGSRNSVDEGDDCEQLMKINSLAQEIIRKRRHESETCEDDSLLSSSDGAPRWNQQLLDDLYLSSDSDEPDSTPRRDQPIQSHVVEKRLAKKNCSKDVSDPEENDECPGAHLVGSKKRKQRTPKKSPSVDDPGFRGAIIKMGMSLEDNETHLRFQHEYRNIRHRALSKHKSTCSNSDSEDDLLLSRPQDYIQKKQCASCGTKFTPLWRDAEDGTPLCNACGIRYKKYKIRCTRCWRIPRKNENARFLCKDCGSTLRYSLLRKADY